MSDEKGHPTEVTEADPREDVLPETPKKQVFPKVVEMKKQAPWELSESVRLPVGILDGDIRYRDVTIEEMSGIDDHLVSGKKSGNNGAKALSLVLCRCVQEVEGMHQYKFKSDPEKLFDLELARKMCQPDRDFLVTRIHMLADNDEGVLAGECPRCNRIWEEDVDLRKMDVYEWPDGEPLQLEFELDVGYVEREGGKKIYHKRGVMRFPTGKEQELVGKMDDESDIIDAMLASCIIELGTLEAVSQEIVKRFKSRDRRKLMTIIARGLPGLRQWKTVECRCGREFDIKLDVSAFFEGRRSTTKPV